MQIYTLEHADAEALAPIVKSVLTVLVKKNGQQGGQPQKGQPQPPQQPGQQKGGAPGTDELDVVAYKSANWLVVVAPAEILTAAESLVKELDRERPPELSLRVLPIQFAEAGEVANQLSPLFRSGRRNGSRRLLRSARTTARIRCSFSVPKTTSHWCRGW